VRDLNVEPLSAVSKYRNTDLDARQVARELNVANVLTGSYIKEGDDLRVTLEFIDVAKNTDPWRDNIELKSDKLFMVQDRVAIRMFHLMGVELQPEEIERLNRGAPTSPAAYEYYLRSIDLGFKSDYQAAAKLLEKSVALEPRNAMAWTELATVYLGYGEIQGGASGEIEKGWQAFHHALNLDPANRFIVDLMAFQLLEHSKVDEAVRLLRESIRRNPNDSFAHWYLSEAYRYGGALDQSLAEGELALRLNPNVAENTTFNTYLYVGRYQKFLDTLPPDEKSPRTVFYRGLGFYYLGDQQRAAQEFDRAHELNPQLFHAKIGRALTFAVRHRNAEGLDVMHRVERSTTADGEMVYKMAQAYAQLGDDQTSLHLLRNSIDLNFYPYTYFVSDPLLQPLRGNAEFSALMYLAHQRQEAFCKALQ
jgi:tetratricopeptide (TPR) repeat protein